MRILVVTQYFWPENFRINDLCAELVNRGHEVTVLTGKPNYPDGKVFDGYLNKPADYNEHEGATIIRVPMLARGKGSSLKLGLNYLSFALSASSIGLLKLRDKQFDVIFVCQLSPITSALPAILYRAIRQTPIAMWVLDLWPDSLAAVGTVKSPRVLALVGQLVSFIYSRCDLILGQSKAFYKGISVYCDQPNKIGYFPSWAEQEFSHSSLQVVDDLSGNEGVFKILFAGNIGKAQDFPAIIEAVEILRQKEIPVKVFVVGDGRALDSVMSEVEKKDLGSHIIFLGRHPLSSMPSFYASVDALLVSLKDDPAFSKTIPGKVQSYMATGKPILTMLSGEGSRVVEEASCGYVASSGDSDKLAGNIVKISQLPVSELMLLGDNARHYSEQEFNRDHLITKLEVWLANLVDTHASNNSSAG
jgi:colanic acid biosynthesis glycosyl transferase WcaI